MARSQKDFIQSHQPKIRKIFARIDGTGTASVVTGKNQVTLTDTDTGDYLITLTYPPKQILGISIQSLTKHYHQVGTITGTTSFQVLSFTDAGIPGDSDFFVEVTATDSAYDF